MTGYKKWRKRVIKETVTIDGLELVWELRSEPQFTTEHGHKGLCISVRLATGVRRELILEYPSTEKKQTGFAHAPEHPRIIPKVVEADIRRAIEAGWRPASRGRPFIFLVPETTH
jgi:hypothetical protein